MCSSDLAVQEIARIARIGNQEISASSLAERFGFAAARQWTPVGDLSGGERRRLQLLRLLAAEPNVLLLDEPTNDLDTDTLASLEDLLDSWPGTMIVASHDRYLVERVTDSAYGMFGDGRLVHLPGGVDEYLARAATRLSGGVPETLAQETPSGTGLSAGELRQARKDLARLERQLGKLEERILKINESLAEHGADYQKIVELEAQLKAVQEERGQVEEAWLELAESVPQN